MLVCEVGKGHLLDIQTEAVLSLGLELCVTPETQCTFAKNRCGSYLLNSKIFFLGLVDNKMTL